MLIMGLLTSDRKLLQMIQAEGIEVFWNVLNVGESVLENDKDQGSQVGIPITTIPRETVSLTRMAALSWLL